MGEEKKGLYNCHLLQLGGRCIMFCFVLPYTEFVVKKEDTGISNATTI